MSDPVGNAKSLEAVVGIFDDAEAALRAARELDGTGFELHRVSKKDPDAEKELPEIWYDHVEKLSEEDVSLGVLKGSLIGTGSGLLFIGVPGLNIAAPIAGALVGAWIGAIAGIDETERGIKLPDLLDYNKQLAAGKSFVVITADENKRIELAAKLEQLGAVEVNQHPPVQEASFHQPKLLE